MRQSRSELSDYECGYLDGMWAYAWWKDGVVYVGTTGMTYKDAVKRFLAEREGKSWLATEYEKATR